MIGQRGGGQICRGWRSIRWTSVTVAAGGREDGENSSSSDAAIATMTWVYGDYLLMTPADQIFDLVIDKGNLDYVMCYSDHIEGRMNI